MEALQSPRDPKTGDRVIVRPIFFIMDGDLTNMLIFTVEAVNGPMCVIRDGKLVINELTANLVVLTPETVFPSTRQILQHEISVREVGGRGWAFYWMEGGAEFTFLSGGEGPYEIQHNDWQDSLDEAMEMIGGDQECVLTPASLRRFGVDVPRKRRH